MKIFSAVIYVGRILISIIFIILVIPAYSSSLDPFMTLTESNSGSVLTARRGQVFEVVLPMNPTTGYQWEAVCFNKDILKQGTTRFIRQDGTYGTGGVVEFRFKALVEGETKLKIGYFRPFDNEKKMERLFQVVIKVDTKKN